METTDKIKNALNIYAFISQVNREMIRGKDKDSLFSKLCQLAVESGKFKIAWIGLFDFKNKITLKYHSGLPSTSEEINLFTIANKPQETVLQTGIHYLCNNINIAPEFSSFQNINSKINLQSCIVLPIRQSGAITGTLNLYATEIGFYEKEEIELLVDLSNDISFALDEFILEEKHKEKKSFHLKLKNTFATPLIICLKGFKFKI